MKDENSKGFTACGKFYSMTTYEIDYISFIQNLLIEIRQNKIIYESEKV